MAMLVVNNQITYETYTNCHLTSHGDEIVIGYCVYIRKHVQIASARVEIGCGNEIYYYVNDETASYGTFAEWIDDVWNTQFSPAT